MKSISVQFNHLFLINVLIISSFAAAFAQETSIEQEEKEARAEEIIKNYITALGGKQRLNQIQSLIIKGQGRGATYDMMLPMTVYVKNPGMNKVEISIMNQKIIMATDGEMSWGLNPFMGNGQPRQMPLNIPNENNNSINNNVFFTIGKNLIDYKEKGFQAEYVGKTNFQGKKAFRLKLKSDLTEDDYYIDTENYYLLMAKVDYSKNYFDNYKKVGDIFFPHSIEGGKQNFKMEVEQVILNDSIDNEEFKMPFTQFNTEEHVLLNQSIDEETFEFSDTDHNPQELIKLYASAVGNNTDVLSFRSIHAIGQMTLGKVEIPFQVYSKQPDKFRMEMTMMNQLAITATNGRKSWEVSPFEGIDQAVEIEESELTQDKAMFSFGRELIEYASIQGGLNYMGKTKVKGREAHVLKITQISEEILYFIDTQSYHLLLKHNKMTGNQEFYGEYKKINNVLIPHKLERYDRLENSNIKIKFDSFDFDTKLSNKLFSFPGK